MRITEGAVPKAVGNGSLDQSNGSTTKVLTPRRPSSAEFALADITDTGDLLRYAAKAQLTLLKRRKSVSQKEVAAALGVSEQTLSNTLNNVEKNGRDIESVLHGLDAAVFAFDSEITTATGGLVALAARLQGYKHDATVVGQVPPAWVTELLGKTFERPMGFLIQASALLSAFMGASSQKASDAICAHHMQDLDKVVYPLLMIGLGAPTPHSIDALILLGGLSRHQLAFEGSREVGFGVSDMLDEALRDSPLGFRVWRVITAIVHAASPPVDQDGRSGRGRRSTKTTLETEHLETWVKTRLTRKAAELRQTSLYPARSLDLELTIAIPTDWTSDQDWAAEVLASRALDAHANLRERATAAMGLWERALSYPTDQAETKRAQAKRQIEMIITALVREQDQERNRSKDNRSRPYDSAPPGGREWLIDSLRYVLTQNRRVVNEWPAEESKHPCLKAVAAGLSHLREDRSIPGLLRLSTEFLFRQTLLQNAGVYRRKAIDALRGAGFAKQTTQALAAVLKCPDAEPWLRCRILFAIGFLQERGNDVEDALQQAFLHARDQLNDALRDDRLTRDLVSELHAALFGIGDCYGAPGQEVPARRMRDFLKAEGLWRLVDNCDGPKLFLISRAAAYLLTVTPQGKEDRELLERLAESHPDETTRKACAWARRMRFVEGSDTVRPLHLASRPRIA